MRIINVEGYGDFDTKYVNYRVIQVIKYKCKNYHYKATLLVEDPE